MRRYLIWLAVITLLLAVLAGGCAKAPPAAVQTPAAPKATTPAVVTPITMKFATWMAPNIAMTKPIAWYLDEIEKQTQGRIKFERYWSESMAPAKELLSAVTNGIADMAFINPTYNPADVPLATVGWTPLFEDQWAGMSAFTALYEQEPVMAQELAKNKARFMMNMGMSTYRLITTKPVRTLEDIKGMKIRATGAQMAVVQGLGGVAVNILPPDLYTAMERGTIDGIVFSPSGAVSYNIQEVAKYWFTIPFGGACSMQIMSLDKWNKLPDDIKKIIEPIKWEMPKVGTQAYQVEGDGAAMEKFKLAGVNITEASPELKKKVWEITEQTAGKSWTNDMNGKGLPGTQIYNKYKELIAKYVPLSPFK